MTRRVEDMDKFPLFLDVHSCPSPVSSPCVGEPDELFVLMVSKGSSMVYFGRGIIAFIILCIVNMSHYKKCKRSHYPSSSISVLLGNGNVSFGFSKLNLTGIICVR